MHGICRFLVAYFNDSAACPLTNGFGDLESLEFIALIASFAIVLFWYLQNEQGSSQGLRGLLAMVDDPDATKPEARRPSYRMKTRLARRAHELRDIDGVKDAAQNAKPAFRKAARAGRMRRKFRRQDEARYRVKDRKKPAQTD